ncbi:hypothetical protein [Nonomuraea sp. NPDC052265]|uniref:hypothetical protein n=1 Tax=Nonomuraea sp. NPDC052265 TaxID=3364374 RepID=UPI0037C7EB88
MRSLLPADQVDAQPGDLMDDHVGVPGAGDEPGPLQHLADDSEAPVLRASSLVVQPVVAAMQRRTREIQAVLFFLFTSRSMQPGAVTLAAATDAGTACVWVALAGVEKEVTPSVSVAAQVRPDSGTLIARAMCMVTPCLDRS